MMDRILIIDDEPQVLAGLRRAIGRHFDIDAVSCAGEALRRLTDGERYAAIVSDLSMTEIDGVALLERARQVAPSIPRILLTGHGDRSALMAAINRAGVTAFLQKPTPPSELLQVLQRAIRESAIALQGRPSFQDAEQHWIASELAEADHDEHFRLLLQPRVAASDGRLVAAEALLRWTHPRRGPVSPSQFIPAAEATGLIEDITGWVLRQAARHWCSLRAAGLDLPISVNISPYSIVTGLLADQVRAALSVAGMPAERLEIEITETYRLEQSAQTRRTLAALRAQGVRTALDDFGTGHSSLEALRTLEVDTLKIDRSFVADIGGNPKHLEIVRSIVALSRALRLEVVAEGVETVGQASLLESLGVDQFQGYLFAPALPPGELLQRCLSDRSGRARLLWRWPDPDVAGS
jgi:EAL domain-containing protein (putative c-di-GMP-specific phosphodiesterase class I)/CheY-like chemotaxis protein